MKKWLIWLITGSISSIVLLIIFLFLLQRLITPPPSNDSSSHDTHNAPSGNGGTNGTTRKETSKDTSVVELSTTEWSEVFPSNIGIHQQPGSMIFLMDSNGVIDSLTNYPNKSDGTKSDETKAEEARLARSHPSKKNKGWRFKAIEGKTFSGWGENTIGVLRKK